MRKYFALFVFAAIVFSCTKYEDGPVITFRGKKKRLEGSWKYHSIIYVDQNITVTTGLPPLVMTFAKNGDYSDTYGYSGSWVFTGSVDLKINKSKDTSNTEILWEIIRLANKQLWLRKDKVEHHFIPE